MRLGKLTAVILAALAALGGLPLDARATGGAEQCLVTDKSVLAGRDKITGSAVVVLTNYNEAQNSADAADATLTLKFHGTTAVFRAHLPEPPATSVPILTAEDVLCNIFAAEPLTDSGQTTFDVFGIPADQFKLCLIREEKAGSQGAALTCQSVVGLNFSQIPGTNNFSGTANLNIYIIP